MDNIQNNLHPFTPQYHLFRAYDIRGNYRYFTNDFVNSLALSFARIFNTNQSAATKTIVLGYDMRDGSEDIAKHLATVFVKNNFNVVWLGLITTPMMVFWAHQQAKGQQNGLIVTASHSAKNTTGIKWIVDGETPSSQEIQLLYQDMINNPIFIKAQETLSKSWEIDKHKLTVIKTPELDYQAGITQAVAKIYQSQNKTQTLIDCIVVDCLNGATSNIAKTIFSQYATKVIMLNDTPDGSFPKGNPDPSEKNRLIELENAVKQHHANIGLAFDGDGDRLVVVDNKGDILNPDNLLYLLAKTALAGQKSLQSSRNKTSDLSQKKVIFDVKCSHQLPKMLSALGITPVMSKTGSNHMRYEMQRSTNPTLFAGEHSGHFIFNDGLFIAHDDAIYASIRLMTWLSSQRQSLSDIVTSLPTMISTADTYIPLPVSESQSIISKLITILKNWIESSSVKIKNSDNLSNINSLDNKLPAEAHLSTIDGIRLDFDNGFGVIRQSNTSPSLTVRLAGDTLSDFKKIQQQLVKICKELDEKLAKAIANIQPLAY